MVSQPGYRNLPRSQWEFYELCIEETGDIGRPGFIVKQTRCQWSEIDGQVMWEEPECDRWLTLRMAEEGYEGRLHALRARGFTESDMGF